MVVRGLVPTSTVDQSMAARRRILEKQGKPIHGSGRIFQFAEKLAVEDPEAFANYFANPLM